MSEQVVIDNGIFNSNPSKRAYTELLDKYNIERPKCRICGEDIYYKNILMHNGKRHDYPKLCHGSTYASKKEICGNTYYLTVCEDCMRDKFPEWDTLNISKVFNRPNKYAQYAFDIPEVEIEKKNKELCSRTLESFILKHGNQVGKKKWEEYLEKERYTKSFEYRQKKYRETPESFTEFNASRACTLKNFINRYGEEEGVTKWNAYVERQRYTISKDYFIEKYGEKDGNAKYEKFDKSRLCLHGYSNVSQKLFDMISSLDLVKSDEIYYATRNYEYQIRTSNNKVYYLDFYDKTLNICIEYNGNAFHPNPIKYKETDFFKLIFEKEVKPVKWFWDNEKERIRSLKEEFGIETIVIWENEFNGKEIPQKIINKIIQLKDGI